MGSRSSFLGGNAAGAHFHVVPRSKMRGSERGWNTVQLVGPFPSFCVFCVTRHRIL
jgi:diadenosine tetraphosphate (Ap4A) HIT family hydrolase